MTTIADVLCNFGENNVSMGHIECGEGWYPIIIECHERLLEIAPDYKILQIKEKFGGLRYYTDVRSDEMAQIIREAEEKCWKTCEQCGEPGKAWDEGGWWATLCEEHHAAWMSRRDS